MKVLTIINTVAIIALALLVGLTLHELSEFKKQSLRAVPAPQTTLPSEDISGWWQITHGKEGERQWEVSIRALGDNRYRLNPKNLVFNGVYELKADILRMVDENPGYPDLVWMRKDVNTFQMIEGNYIGAVMKRQ